MDAQSRKILHNTALDAHQSLPKSLLMHAIEKSEHVVLDDAREPYQPFYQDPYFVEDRLKSGDNTLKSILCQPILSQGRLIGLLYLENKLTTHVFHQSRLKLIQMMAAQAAISIENVQLYENLEEKVKDRTRQLKAAQEKLVQHARESGKSEIAIGVMHNIGNALTPLKTVIDLTYNSVMDSPSVKNVPAFLEFTEKIYESLVNSEPVSDFDQKKAHEVLKMLPGILNDENLKLKEQLEQTHNHIKRIEKFVHLQSQYTQVETMNESIDLNQLIKDVITMLDEIMLRENIQVVLEQQKLPIISAEKYHLLQIVMNLIKNACEAMKDVAFAQRKLHITTAWLPAIESSTETGNELTFFEERKKGKDYVLLRIVDHGIGFKPEESNYPFSPEANAKRSIDNHQGSIGLHESANYLIAKKSKLYASSQGLGQGSTFTMLLLVQGID